MMTKFSFRPLAFATGMAAALALSACADGVELNGKIFDAMGVSTASLQKSSGTPKVAERQALVLPPDPSRLPEPGSGARDAQLSGANDALPLDADEKKKMAQSDLERQQAEYCKKNYDTAKALAMKVEANMARGPLGPCAGNSMLKGVIPGTN